MKSFGLSMAAVTLTGLFLGNMPPVLGQSNREIQAEELLQSAEQLASENANTATVIAAYEEALAAYEGDFDQGLRILAALVEVSYEACLDDEAVAWAEKAVARFNANQHDFDWHNRVYKFSDWIDRLISLYHNTGQMDRIYDTYGAALNTLATIPPQMRNWPLLDLETRYLRSQLSLDSINSRQAAISQQRLLAAHRRAGAITEIDGLLSDAAILLNQENASLTQVPELLQQALTLSRLHNYPPGEFKAVVLIGKQLLKTGDYTEAVVYGKTALIRFNHVQQSDSWLEHTHFILAQAQQELENTTEAIEHYQTLLELINKKQVRIPAAQQFVVVNLIRLYRQTGQTALANQLTSDYSDLLHGSYYSARSFPYITTATIINPSTTRVFQVLSRNLCLP